MSRTARCSECGHVWRPRNPNVPARCPACGVRFTYSKQASGGCLSWWVRPNKWVATVWLLAVLGYLFWRVMG